MKVLKVRQPVNTDLIGGAIGLGLTLTFWFGRGQWSPLSAAFPNTVLVIMGFLSAALLIKGFVKPDVRPLFAEGSRLRAVVTAVVLFGWVWAMRFLGFYLASLVAFSALTIYIAFASRKVTMQNATLWVVIIAVELAVFYLIFSRLLQVPLPSGVLRF